MEYNVDVIPLYIQITRVLYRKVPLKRPLSERHNVDLIASLA